MRAKAVVSITDEFIPGALQRAMNADQGRQQDIQLTRFDFLDRPDIQIDQFREPLLRQALIGAL